MNHRLEGLADNEGFVDLRDPIKLGYPGIVFVRPGDRVLYSTENDTMASSVFADVTILSPDEVGSAVDTIKDRIVPREERSAASIPIKLNTPFIAKRRFYGAGTVLYAEANHLYWDRAKPFPAQRIADYIIKNAPDSP